MPKKNRKTSTKSPEEGAVGVRMDIIFDSDERLICRCRFLLKRLPLPLERVALPEEKPSSSNYFDMILIKRCVKPPFMSSLVLSRNHLDFDQKKTSNEPAETVVISERGNEEV